MFWQGGSSILLSIGYPILLRLQGRPCVIVGGGKVAIRKCRDLLATGARIVIISQKLSADFETLAADHRIVVETASYVPGMLKKHAPFLVFAATDNPQVNRLVAEEARSLRALVDIVDENCEEPAPGDFSSMAAVRRGPITVGIATGGTSPALAVHLRREIEELVGPEYAALAERLADLRPLIRTRLPNEADRRRFWQALVDSPLLDHLQRGDSVGADRVIQETLAHFGQGRDS